MIYSAAMLHSDATLYRQTTQLHFSFEIIISFLFLKDTKTSDGESTPPKKKQFYLKK